MSANVEGNRRASARAQRGRGSDSARGRGSDSARGRGSDSARARRRRGTDSGWVGEPLPRGRHKLGPETVRASQRARLIRAMLETVAEEGYEAATVPKVVARARASRNAFYEFFTDKTNCFIAACDEEAGELLGIVLGFASESDWVRALSEGTRAYLEWWAARPAFARAYLIGLPMAGEPAVAQRERGYARFRAMFLELGRRARVEQRELPPLPELAPRILVSAITDLVAEEVRAGRIEQLPELQPEIVLIALKLLADDETARRAAGLTAHR